MEATCYIGKDKITVILTNQSGKHEVCFNRCDTISFRKKVNGEWYHEHTLEGDLSFMNIRDTHDYLRFVVEYYDELFNMKPQDIETLSLMFEMCIYAYNN